MGNWMLKMWAEHPEVRSSAQATTSPFVYDDTHGTVYMTPTYCKSIGMDYGSGKCSSDADCKNGGKWAVPEYNPSIDKKGKTIATGTFVPVCSNASCTANTDCIEETCVGGYCVGDTSTCIHNAPLPPKIGLRDTILKGNNVKACSAKKSVTREKANSIPLQLKKILQNIPTNVYSTADDNLVKSKNILASNFAGNEIHLYIIQWTGDIQPNINIGFLASEVEEKYPDIVKLQNNVKTIVMNKHELHDPHLKRIFSIIGAPEILIHLFVQKNNPSN